MSKLTPATAGRTDKLMGGCRTAELVETGQVGSTTTPEEWHRGCPGAHVDGRGRTTRCTCSCHDGQQHCIRCGQPGIEGDTLDSSLRCINEPACLERYRQALESNPRHTRWREYKAAAEAERAERRAEEDRAISAGERKPRQRNGKTPQPCHHGCGEMTKGGLFVMGHDAKLKGILMRAGEDGDVNSIIELMARNWLPNSGKGRDRYAGSDLDLAAERFQKVATEDFLEARVAERYKITADGVDPEAAVRIIGGLQ